MHRLSLLLAARALLATATCDVLDEGAVPVDSSTPSRAGSIGQPKRVG